jgi:pantetheine-phosphate adenylyltransferase
MIAFMTHEAHTFLSSSTVKEIAALEGNVTSMVPPFVDQALKERYRALQES